MVEIARIALRAGHSGTSAGAGMVAIPRRVGMVFTYPANVLAKAAFHRDRVDKTHQQNPSARASSDETLRSPLLT